MHEHGYFSGTYPNRRHVLPWWQVATGIRTQRNPIKKNEERMKKPEIKSSRKPCNQIYATCIFLEGKEAQISATCKQCFLRDLYLGEIQPNPSS
jgi:hypothetical protein